MLARLLLFLLVFALSVAGVPMLRGSDKDGARHYARTAIVSSSMMYGKHYSSGKRVNRAEASESSCRMPNTQQTEESAAQHRSASIISLENGASSAAAGAVAVEVAASSVSSLLSSPTPLSCYHRDAQAGALALRPHLGDKWSDGDIHKFLQVETSPYCFKLATLRCRGQQRDRDT